MSRVPESERLAIAELAARQAHDEGPEIEIVQHWPLYVSPHPCDLKLALVAWEESLVPLEMVRQINKNFDGVLVWTSFVAKALIDSGTKIPIRVIGYAPDLDAYMALGERRLATPRLQRPTRDMPFTFLHISSCFARKGVDVLLTAYNMAFQRDQPVRLIIKGFPNPHNEVQKQISELQKRNPDAPEISMINRDMPVPELLNLYRVADCVVLPTRGEGFNIPAAEALAAGVPLIVTGHGGHNDFIAEDIARRVDYRFAQSSSHLKSYDSVWSEPDIDDLAAAMREAFEAAYNDKATAEISTRLRKGHHVAASIGDNSSWGSRVRNIALDLLIQKQRVPITAPIAWVSTWHVRCGIAAHSQYLLDYYPRAAEDVIVLCEDSTPAAQAEMPGKPKARLAWKAGDTSSIERLAGEITATRAPVVVIQYQPGLIRPEALTGLLDNDRLAGRQIIVAFHNLLDLLGSDHWEEVRKTLGRVSRLLVHSIRDQNLLKSAGLVDNVTLFPLGALEPTLARPRAKDLPRSSAPIIGTYGFFLPQKGFDVLIAALARLRTDWPSARLRMVTAEYPINESASEVIRNKALAQPLGVADAIEWHTDFLPDERSLALLNGCDLLVLPYRDTPESASSAVRIAMASRVPVMVTPVAIFDDLGDAVIRAGGMDAEAIASAMASALDDPNLRHAAVDEAERWLKAHHWALMSERLFGMIAGLTANERLAPAITGRGSSGERSTTSVEQAAQLVYRRAPRKPRRPLGDPVLNDFAQSAAE